MLTAYPQPGKQKAVDVCQAFVTGRGGRVQHKTPPFLLPGGAVFYGIRPAWLHLYRQVQREGLDWWYLDNSYFDVAREQQFRATLNATQHDGRGSSNGRRLRALGVKVEPWRPNGRTILVCPQSFEFLSTVAGDPIWLQTALHAIRAATDRPIVIRRKHDPVPMQDALADAHMVVTHSSAVAVEALLAGVPVSCNPSSAASMFSTPIREIERPVRIDGRENWAAVLADNQFTLDEMRHAKRLV